MWLRMGKSDAEQVVAALLKANNDKLAGAVHAAILSSELDEIDEAFLEAAQKTQNYGEVEVDEDAVVSVSSDGGAYVMSWVWLDAEDAGLAKCEECYDVFLPDGYERCSHCRETMEEDDLEDDEED